MTRFWKMTGSGNDFVFIDDAEGRDRGLDSPEMIRRICSRTDGIGADGVVFLAHGAADGLAIRYFNRDGSRGELCGNASLCTTNLAVRRGLATAGSLGFRTDIGRITARMAGEDPQIDLQPVRDIAADTGIHLEAGEKRIGYANTGVPHLVVLVDDARTAPLGARGPELRNHRSLSAGANVNFVSADPAGWRMRTYERGVEAETLACGTGAVASAVLLVEWGLAPGPDVDIVTSSGRVLRVSLTRTADGIRPSLSGEGRIVFTGEFGDL